MSHFQLPDGTRLWAREFSDEKIAIHLGVEVELEQWGSTNAFGKSPRIQLDKQGPVELRLIGGPTSDKSFTISRQKFALKAVGEGIATLNGLDDDGTVVTTPLKVVAGEFRYHDGMVRDLLADVGRSSDPQRLHLLQRYLHNDYGNLFNQFNESSILKHHSPLACGRVAKAGGETLIGKVTSHNYEKSSSYHKPLRKLTKRDDIEYDPGFMFKVRSVIAGHVKRGRPVLVGCTYEPNNRMLKDGHLQATRDGGHSVLIVGCDEVGKKFLYVDPFPGGSNLKYKGGIASDSYPPECFYMGTFEVDSWEDVLGRGPVLRKHKDLNGPWGGQRFLEVISGPTF